MAKELIDRIRAAEEEAQSAEQEAKRSAQDILSKAQKDGAKLLRDELAAEKLRSEKALEAIAARNEADAESSSGAAAQELAGLEAGAKERMSEAKAAVIRILTE